MAQGIFETAGSGSGRGDRELWLAFAAAVTAVCLGGAVAIATAERGASTAVSLSLMAAIVLAGVVAACCLAQRALRPGAASASPPVASPAVRPTRRSVRRARRTLKREMRRDLSTESATLLEKQLSARYGVPVRRVAWHVWCIKGELVEATLDRATGQLIAGGRELSL